MIKKALMFLLIVLVLSSPIVAFGGLVPVLGGDKEDDIMTRIRLGNEELTKWFTEGGWKEDTAILTYRAVDRIGTHYLNMDKEALIWWITTQPTTGYVKYGLDENLDMTTPVDQELLYQHAILITGLTPNKHYYYRVVSTNAEGEKATSKMRGLSTDITPPILNIISPKDGDKVSGIVRFEFEATDNVGILAVNFCINGVRGRVTLDPEASWDNWDPKKDFQFPPSQSILWLKSPPYIYSWDSTVVEDGEYGVEVTAEDLLGRETRKMIMINVDNIPPDTTPPTVRITYPQNGQKFSQEFNLTVEASDDQSGVGEVIFWMDGHDEGYVRKPPYQKKINPKIDEKRKHTFQAEAIDKEGNSAKSEKVQVEFVEDAMPPVTTHNYLYDNLWTNQDVNITLIATDDISGVKATYYLINGGAQQTGTNISISNEGTYVIEFWSEDNVGNIEARHTITVRIDKTPPVIVIYTDPQEGIWPPDGKAVTVTVRGSAEDTLSGVVSKVFTVTDEYNEISPTLNDFNQTIELLASRRGDDLDGRVYTIKVDVVDNAGNRASGQTDVVVPHDRRK